MGRTHVPRCTIPIFNQHYSWGVPTQEPNLVSKKYQPWKIHLHRFVLESLIILYWFWEIIWSQQTQQPIKVDEATGCLFEGSRQKRTTGKSQSSGQTGGRGGGQREPKTTNSFLQKVIVLQRYIESFQYHQNLFYTWSEVNLSHIKYFFGLMIPLNKVETN